MTEADQPILIVGLRSYRDETPFRSAAAVLWSPENNLSEPNMDWYEFENAAKASGGVFHGF
jgi:hypothetical protein